LGGLVYFGDKYKVNKRRDILILFFQRFRLVKKENDYIFLSANRNVKIKDFSPISPSRG